MKKTPTRTRSRDRSRIVVINPGGLRGILGHLAQADAQPLGESPNMSRTVRRLIAEEAQRRGISHRSGGE